MKKMLYRALCLLLAGVFLVSCFFLVRQLVSYHAARTIYDEAKTLAGMTEGVTRQTAQSSAPSDQAEDTAEPQRQGETGSTEVSSEADAAGSAALPEELSFLNGVTLSALQEVNGDVLGWLYLPESTISYPIVASHDNSEYLTQAWDGSHSAGGSIFLDCRNEIDLRDPNVILYGHRMRDGSMFAALKNYRKADYWRTHPTIYLVTEEEIRAYTVFSAYEAAVESNTYDVTYSSEEARAAAVKQYWSQSQVSFGTLAMEGEASAWSDFTPDGDSSILTLSTCNGRGTYETRWVVQAAQTQVWSRS